MQSAGVGNGGSETHHVVDVNSAINRYECKCGHIAYSTEGMLAHLKYWAKPTFDSFTSKVRGLLDGKAAQKGYSDTGADGPNLLFEFVKKMGLTHAEGEVVYKIVRWHTKHDVEDLEKAAAWCGLIWQHRDASKGGNSE